MAWLMKIQKIARTMHSTILLARPETIAALPQLDLAQRDHKVFRMLESSFGAMDSKFRRMELSEHLRTLPMLSSSHS